MEIPSNLAKSRAFLHIAAITAAILIAGSAYLFVPEIPVTPPYDGLYIPRVGGLWVIGEGYGTGEIATENLVQMSSALSSGRTVVVLGSSELQATGLDHQPYNFLTKSRHIPVLAYGYSYLNSIGAYALLAANADALSPKTRLVIILSPTWFWHPAPSNYVIANLQPQVLIHLYRDPEARKVINEYFQQHKDEFTRVSPTQEAFTRNDDQYMQAMETNEHLYSLKIRLRSILFANLSVPSYERPPFEAPSASAAKGATKPASTVDAKKPAPTTREQEIAEKERLEQEKIAEKNRLEQIADTEKNLRAISSEDLDTNPEFSMLENIVALLKRKHVQALFVFQPLNPGVYKDAMQANLIGRKVSTLMDSAGMQYFDMSDVSKYQDGTLRDNVHLGELGWLMVDNRILGYLGQQ